MTPDMMNPQSPLCPNCGGIVPPSRNSGVPRVYCTIRCRRAYNAKKEYARERGIGKGIVLYEGVPWFNRVIAQSAGVARKRLEEHNEACPFSGEIDDGCCPAMFDPYDRKRLCLIHAVLNEDWSQLMAEEEQQPFEREITTSDGHWLSDYPEGGRVRAGTGLTPEQRDALIAAGAARPS